ncbi:MAG TPA: MDR family MFS transporter [Mycobacteriales bacterium]|nr:MDR family MFS transporter [Mycobacteriales bacterium]
MTGTGITSAGTEPTVVTTAARRRVLTALLLSMALAAVDTTIVATAVPSIVHDLGGFGAFPWVFSAYLLAQAVTIPLYGKFADLFGRKPVLLVGIGLFLVGSVLCGSATGMTSLIVFRAVQGLGAGAVQPVTTTIVADIYSLEERGRVQGYLSSVWAVTAVCGPALGGLFAEYDAWRWIFFVNIPLGLVAAALLHRNLTESPVRREHRLDVAGATTLAVGLGLVVFALLRMGNGWSWTSPAALTTLGLGAAGLVTFGAVERRAAEPIMPGFVFGRRMLVTGNASAFCVGALLFGLSSYLPTYAQGVLGASPFVAGLTVAAISVSWSVSATASSRLYLRAGFRTGAVIGGVCCVGGAVMFASLSAGSPVAASVAACLVVGLGLGFAFTTVLVAVQTSVRWERRGVVTGANMFTRAIGSALGVAVLGSIANSTVTDALDRLPPGTDVPHSLDAAARVLGGSATSLPAEAVQFLRQSLFDATHNVFVALVVVAVAMLAAQLMMPARDDPGEPVAADAARRSDH